MYEITAIIIAIIILWHTFTDLYDTITYKKKRNMKRIYDSLRRIEIYMSILIAISVTQNLLNTINGKH